MVPLMSFLIAGRLITRFGPGLVVVAGAMIFGSGLMWWAVAAGVHPNYATGVLAGMLLTGIGVGLTLRP